MTAIRRAMGQAMDRPRVMRMKATRQTQDGTRATSAVASSPIFCAGCLAAIKSHLNLIYSSAGASGRGRDDLAAPLIRVWMIMVGGITVAVMVMPGVVMPIALMAVG